MKKYINFIKENTNNLQLNKYSKLIDFTYIHENANKDELSKIIDIVKTNNFYGIVVNPDLIGYLSYELGGSDIIPICTLDYPDGSSKLVDNKSVVLESISSGAKEINMVIDYNSIKKAYIKNDDEIKKSILDSVENDIREISNECHKNGVIIKIIIESGVLNMEELSIACKLSYRAGVDFIQTSTGTKEVGAEIIKVKEIRRLLPDHINICAAGGIRTLEQCELFYKYVDRIATSVIPK